MQEKETDILIVGAGPTGLVLAAALAKAGVRVHLVEKAASRTDKSKALGIHAGTLEALNGTFGPEIVNRLVREGAKAQEAFLHLNGRKPIRLDLSLIPSTHNYILVLPQSDTERILEEQLAPLSVSVQRQVELVSIAEEGQGVVAQLKDAQGNLHQVRSQYAVGCDGAHSTVRHQLGLAFEGAAFSEEFALGDVRVDWQWPHGAVRLFSSGKGTLFCLPMKGDRRYRVITLLSGTHASEKAAPITLQELQALASNLCPTPIHLSEDVWLTRFRVHQRMTNHFREGRLFLAGDAAHIHSPAGGQGMNTGIQDALNLAGKLVAVLKKGAPVALLDDYEAERLPVAKDVLRGTGLLSRLALLPDYFPLSLVRSLILPLALNRRAVQKRVTALISQVRIARRELAARVQS